MKKLISKYWTLGLSLAIIAYVIFDVVQKNPDAFKRLSSEQKNWTLLGLAWLCILCGVVITFVRWYFLVRALELPFRLRDAFRLGFLGYMLNFVSLGSVGGDLFKAVFIAREQPGRRVQAVSTVVVDRLIGLFGLLLVASIAIMVMQVADIHGPVVTDEFKALRKLTLVATGIGAIVGLAMLLPWFTSGPHVDFLTRLPKIGGFLGSIFQAMQVYRRRRRVLWGALLITLFVHLFNVLGFFLIARSLPGDAPTLAGHFVIIPLALVAGAIPLPLAGLGALELAMEKLYVAVASDCATGLGLIVSLAYRVITILIALVGVAFYLGRRREVAEVLHKAEENTGAGADGDRSAKIP